MDTLSKVRRYLEANPSVLILSAISLDYSLRVFYSRRNRARLAELLCALLSNAVEGFGLGNGARWFAQGGELMREMLDNFLDTYLLSNEERERGREAVRQPHTPTSMLELLALTNAAISRRRDNLARKRYEQRLTLQIAA